GGRRSGARARPHRKPSPSREIGNFGLLDELAQSGELETKRRSENNQDAVYSEGLHYAGGRLGRRGFRTRNITVESARSNPLHLLSVAGDSRFVPESQVAWYYWHDVRSIRIPPRGNRGAGRARDARHRGSLHDDTVLLARKGAPPAGTTRFHS